MSTMEEKRDKFAKIIQKYLEKLPVIILGAGATIPYGLPSMTKLAVHIKDSISLFFDLNVNFFYNKCRFHHRFLVQNYSNSFRSMYRKDPSRTQPSGVFQSVRR